MKKNLDSFLEENKHNEDNLVCKKCNDLLVNADLDAIKLYQICSGCSIYINAGSPELYSQLENALRLTNTSNFADIATFELSESFEKFNCVTCKTMKSLKFKYSHTGLHAKCSKCSYYHEFDRELMWCDYLYKKLSHQKLYPKFYFVNERIESKDTTDTNKANENNFYNSNANLTQNELQDATNLYNLNFYDSDNEMKDINPTNLNGIKRKRIVTQSDTEPQNLYVCKEELKSKEEINAYIKHLGMKINLPDYDFLKLLKHINKYKITITEDLKVWTKEKSKTYCLREHKAGHKQEDCGNKMYHREICNSCKHVFHSYGVTEQFKF
eukprot:Mrub_06274.p1 GENE.Mrub_06274~~Mrub_06274.p1  ORF type:complete len:339 (+),score=39.26 Mrub_06274:41-1018(+)